MNKKKLRGVKIWGAYYSGFMTAIRCCGGSRRIEPVQLEIGPGVWHRQAKEVRLRENLTKKAKCR